MRTEGFFGKVGRSIGLAAALGGAGMETGCSPDTHPEKPAITKVEKKEHQLSEQNLRLRILVNMRIEKTNALSEGTKTKIEQYLKSGKYELFQDQTLLQEAKDEIADRGAETSAAVDSYLIRYTEILRDKEEGKSDYTDIDWKNEQFEKNGFTSFIENY